MRWMGAWIGLAAVVLGASGAGAADQAAARDAYAPLFLLYSGDPSPERLQGLRQFLQAENLPKEVIQDTIDTVVYKLKTFKAGFAYPVYASETATTGNTCVVADSHYNTPTQAIALMTSPRIHQYVLHGHTPDMDLQPVLDSVFEHEIFHCFDLMRQSQTEVGMQMARYGAPYFFYWSEVGADAFAALKHLRNGGDKRLVRQIRDFRTLNLLNGDAMHYTAPTLDYIAWHFDRQRLKTLNLRQLVALAQTIRERTALTPEEFMDIDTVAQRFEAQLKNLTDGDVKVSAAGWQAPATAPDPEQVSQIMLQVRSALYNLDGDISTANRYFYPIMKRYYLPIQFRIAEAGIALD